MQLRQAEPGQRRHEQDPAADAEEAGEHACDEAEQDRERVHHCTSIRTGDRDEERGKEIRERADGQPLLQRRTTRCTDCRRDPDEQRVQRSDLAVDDVRDDARARGDADRGERGRAGGAQLPPGDEQKQRHDHDPAADTEERAEEAG